MKKITQGSAALALFLSLGLTSAHAYTQIGRQLDFGAKNSDVTNLQAFFADNSSIYPEGLVTGYFGSLTRAAVRRFQAFYGIVSSGTAATTGYGRVGPSTLAKINALIAQGGWSTGGNTSDTIAPSIYNLAINNGTNSSTITFNTNENTVARVVYGTGPISFSETESTFAPLSGLVASDGGGLSTSHSINIPSLQGNTLYYYTIIATDQAGNISVWGPNNTLRTAQ